jgi:hypothetical protein
MRHSREPISRVSSARKSCLPIVEKTHPLVYFPAVVDMYWSLDLGRETVVNAYDSHLGVLCHRPTEDVLRVEIAKNEATTMSCNRYQHRVFIKAVALPGRGEMPTEYDQRQAVIVFLGDVDAVSDSIYATVACFHVAGWWWEEWRQHLDQSYIFGASLMRRTAHGLSSSRCSFKTNPGLRKRHFPVFRSCVFQGLVDRRSV